MSENEDNQNRNQFFDVDERRIFPRPLTPPMRVERTRDSDMNLGIRVTIGIAATIALVMIVFGVANYELGFLDPRLEIPVYGVALLIFSFALFNVLRYISENG